MAVTTPPFREVCRSTACERLSLGVHPPPLLSRAELVALALGGVEAQAVETALLSGQRSVSLPVVCPPFCPASAGSAASASVHVAGTVALDSSSSAATAASQPIAGLPDPVLFATRLLQLVPGASGGGEIQGVGGGTVAYVEACTAAGDFEDPTSGVCTNASHPRAARCAYGR